MPDLPRVRIPDGPIVRPDLRVAVVLDEMSTLGFSYEWDQVALTADSWAQRVESHRPQLLFCESTWHGGWRMPRTSNRPPREEIAACVQWFRERDIPTVFWNKEDPPNYDVFLTTARIFDHVFTIDAELLPRYRQDLGHDRVGVLPFAAQPRLHNPVRPPKGRSRTTAFAGTWFAHKYPERREQMQHVLGAAAAGHDLDIYARRQDHERFVFPPPFDAHVVGSLPYERLLAAYTSYQVFLNVNSSVTSSSACARRLFELGAAATPVVSGWSPAIEPFFGDDVAVARSRTDAERELAVLRHPEIRDRRGWRAHRRVFAEHLYGHRVDRVLDAAGLPRVEVDRSVSVVAVTKRPHLLDDLLQTVARQLPTLPGGLELVLLTHGFEPDGRELAARTGDLGLRTVTVRPVARERTLGSALAEAATMASGRYLAKMDDDDHYGAHYLSDLLAAFSWTDAQVVGKNAHYMHLADTGAVLLRFPGSEHRFAEQVKGATLTMPTEVARTVGFADLPSGVDTDFLKRLRADGGSVYSSDRFNFLARRAGRADQDHTWSIDDTSVLASKFAKVVLFGDGAEHVEV